MSVDDDQDGDCVICNSTMTLESGLEPTDICHSCIYGVVDEVRAQLTKATADAEAFRMRCASLEADLVVARGLLQRAQRNVSPAVWDEIGWFLAKGAVGS